jgi:hypothetical protein
MGNQSHNNSSLNYNTPPPPLLSNTTQIQSVPIQTSGSENKLNDPNELIFQIIVEKNQKLLFDNYTLIDLNETSDFFGCQLKGCYYVFKDSQLKEHVYFISFTHPGIKKTILPWTPLQWAAAIGDEEIIQFLLNNGAIDDTKDLTKRNAQEISNYLLHDIKIINNSIKKKLVAIIPKINDITFKFRNK